MTMEVLQVFVAESSFLLREGLKTLLSQMGVSFRMEEINTKLDKLPKIISKSKANLILINPELLPEGMIINRTGFQQHTVIWIALTQKIPNHALAAQFDYVMNVCASRTELIALMETVINRIGLRNKADEGALSERETDVLKYVALGYTNNEISEKLFISIHTVMTHRKNITRKLGIKTVSGLTVYAILHKLISAEQLKGPL